MSLSQVPLLKGIRAVVFDLVGTLVTPEPAVEAVYSRIGRQFGSKLDNATIGIRFRKAFRETERNARPIANQASQDEASAVPPVSPWVTSEQAEYERWRTIVATSLPDVANPEDCFSALWIHFGDCRNWRAYDDAVLTLDRLRQEGMPVALASNFDARLHRVCDGLDTIRSISRRFVSSEVGYRKPAREFFDAVLTGLRNIVPDLAAREVLMVGDDRENDVGGARAAGFRAVRVNRKTEPNWDEIGSLHALTGL